ncbi:bile acid beta-glucosidase [Romeria aff. gracilis LEGE 07310]|uniref:Bile acid beta-glucosidase n=1 Tax=Vasconcelosia minhoensis LEGE 07310 TaxID=915328 RepID=A0A8J7DN60_9CYAN|nr:GH116 family glycosyl hydrolase [Romeria gracilis]MBE9077705.1 bile acid beta-glucosidase [Romeria aff. gracilis LEGE 07310]
MTLPDPFIPDCAWQRPIGAGWETPYVVRYASNLDDGPGHGVPLGGFGAGCIGRAPSGSFNLWHLDGGEHVFAIFPACQFSVFEQTEDRQQAYAMSTEPPTDGSLSEWEFYPANSASTYHALYPRSGSTYRGVFQTELSCEQFSPIWADNYQEASYPVAVFVWTAHNPTDRLITLSLMLSWQNMVGWFTNANPSPTVQQRDDGSPFYKYQPRLGKSAGNFNQRIVQADRVTCVMDGDWSGEPAEGQGQFCIATRPFEQGEIFYHSRWNPAGDGSDLWQSFSQSGTLPNLADEMPAAAGEQVGGAIAVKFTLSPGETAEIPFVLTWDLPVTEFAAGKQAYRRYTDFFGRSGRNAEAMAAIALTKYPSWQQQIQQWQQPILNRSDLPDWLKMALFNELYDLTSGGTLWSAASETDPIGQFGVLECFDYCWYESLDVRLYGGFATLMLWPEIEKSVIRAFARAISAEDSRQRIIGYYYTIGEGEHWAARKLRGATPHDLGAPNEHPWQQTNYTSYQDCNQWKDLPSDFVIQVYRAFVMTGETDVDFLADCWPAVVEALAYLKQFDRDGDGMPENGGAPDQTFDDWQLKGVSAYCGGLWLAALESAIAIGNQLQQHSRGSGNLAILLAQYRRWADQGRVVFQNKLWNGQYYRLDTGSGADVVMADQLCGQFFARLMGLPDIVEPEFTESALEAIYDACFVKFNQYAQHHTAPQNQKFEGAQAGFFSAAQLGLSIGAANGVRPDGSPQNPDDTHQLEVWTGINFGLAAFFAQMGKRDAALEITAAVVQQIYQHGLQFRTPEAITTVGTFRACHYLRPMAIWGLYGALTDWRMELTR